MGIPRLTSAVAPYAETVILGQVLSQSSAIAVTKLIIDGPSLVYHVFNALLRHRHDPSIEPTGVLPSYQQINKCLAQFLEDLTVSGVQIKRIIFDGGLPVSKRPVRQERLETTRQELEKYRKIQTHPLPPLTSSSINRSGLSPHDVLNEPREILWNTSNGFGKKHHLIPPPPFMVSSAIEWLQKSEWSSIIVTVPGEADAYCASEASAFDAAILSDDSDLLLYDIGEKGVVITLRTLEPVEDVSKSGRGWLRGKCFRPIELAKCLGVTNMLAFAFYRSMDATLSTAQIVQQTRTKTLTDSSSDWFKFQQLYQKLDSKTLNHLRDTKCVHCSIQKLDPRIAEMICSMQELEVVHMYLPVLTEDPARDSSWSYGYDIRILAYSIFLWCNDMDASKGKYSHVVEHARRGARVADYQIQRLSQVEMTENLKQLSDRLTGHTARFEASSGTSYLSVARNLINRLWQAPSNDTRPVYHFFAADMVINERIANHKEYQPSFSRLFPLGNRRATIPQLTWEDIHFHANIQCVLYSLRILKQIISYVEPRFPAQLSNEACSAIKRLGVTLSDMPDIEELFLDVESLRHWIMTFPRDAIATDVRMVEHMDSPDSASLANVAPMRNDPLARLADGSVRQQTRPVVDEDDDASTWHVVESKNSKKRRNVDDPQKPTVNSSKSRMIGRRA